MSSLFSRNLLVFLLALALVPRLGAAGPRPPRDPDPVDPASVPRETVRDFARQHGFTRVTETDKELRLQGNVHTLVLEKFSRRAHVNQVLVWLNQPTSRERGHWTLATVDIEKTLAPILRPGPGLAGKGRSVVVLDPGHGGKDDGARAASGITEKAVCLDLAHRVRRHLAASGNTVYLTRHLDQFLTLEERPRRAKAWNADVFVSIHANASTNTAAEGIETFLLAIPGQSSTNHIGTVAPSQLARDGNRHDAANMTLAHALQASMLSATKATDRGIRRARFSVLQDAPAPAALVEVGFLSNPAEAARLATPEHRELLARAIAHGIDNYLREVRRAAVHPAP